MECHGMPWNVPSMGFCRLISLKLDFLQWLSIWFKLSRCFKFDAQVSSMCKGYRVFLFLDSLVQHYLLCSVGSRTFVNMCDMCVISF
jgi:hypothetical protein